MRLTGGAFAVSQQLSEERKGDFGSIKKALFTAFALDSHVTYALFVACHLSPGETIDVCLADLRKLSVPFDRMTERGLEAAFVHGFPNHVRQLLCTSSRMEDMDIFQLLARARAIWKDDPPRPTLITADVEPPRGKGDQLKNARTRCYECDGLNHLARDCLVWRDRLTVRKPKLRKSGGRCSRYEEVGNIFWNCPGKGSGDDRYAPASSPAKM